MANTPNKYSTTIKKGQYAKKVSDSEYQVYHFTTDTNQVTLDEGLSSILTVGPDIPAGTTLQQALQIIKENADSGGNAATTLDSHIRDQNNPHNVTAKQLNLEKVENRPMDQSPSAASPNYITSGAVYLVQTLAQSAKDRAEGRSRAFVFNTIDDFLDGRHKGGLFTVKADFQVGDSAYLVPAKVCDFWVSSSREVLRQGDTVATKADVEAVSPGGSVLVHWGNQYVTLVAMEGKVDLTPYLTTESANQTYVKKNDTPVFKGDVSGTGTYRNGVTMTLSQTGVAEGTYSAVTVNLQGRVTKGYQMVAFADGLDDPLLDDLAVNGIAVIEN